MKNLHRIKLIGADAISKQLFHHRTKGHRAALSRGVRVDRRINLHCVAYANLRQQGKTGSR